MCIHEYNEYTNIGVVCGTFTAIQPFAAGDITGYNSYHGGQMKVTNFIGFAFPHAVICYKKEVAYLKMCTYKGLSIYYVIRDGGRGSSRFITILHRGAQLANLGGEAR